VRGKGMARQKRPQCHPGYCSYRPGQPSHPIFKQATRTAIPPSHPHGPRPEMPKQKIHVRATHLRRCVTSAAPALVEEPPRRLSLTNQNLALPRKLSVLKTGKGYSYHCCGLHVTTVDLYRQAPLRCLRFVPCLHKCVFQYYSEHDVTHMGNRW
jgi:hypothetical protein